MNETTIKATGCMDCPFHSQHNAPIKELAVDIYCNFRQPSTHVFRFEIDNTRMQMPYPSWCPLKSGPVKVEME